MRTRDQWTVAGALQVLQHPHVDSKTWAEAAEWLMLYGPPAIQQLLREASGYATRKSFPDLRPSGYTPDGEPCYDLQELAKRLEISVEEAARIIAAKEEEHGRRQLFGKEETWKLQ